MRCLLAVRVLLLPCGAIGLVLTDSVGLGWLGLTSVETHDNGLALFQLRATFNSAVGCPSPCPPLGPSNGTRAEDLITYNELYPLLDVVKVGLEDPLSRVAPLNISSETTSSTGLFWMQLVAYPSLCIGAEGPFPDHSVGDVVPLLKVVNCNSKLLEQGFSWDASNHRWLPHPRFVDKCIAPKLPALSGSILGAHPCHLNANIFWNWSPPGVMRVTMGDGSDLCLGMAGKEPALNAFAILSPCSEDLQQWALRKLDFASMATTKTDTRLTFTSILSDSQSG